MPAPRESRFLSTLEMTNRREFRQPSAPERKLGSHDFTPRCARIPLLICEERRYQIGYHGHGIGSGFNYRAAVRSRDSANRNQWLARERASLTYSFEADDRIRIRLARRRKYWADRNVVGGRLVRRDDLLRIVRRDAEPALRADDFAGAFRRKIILAEVNAIEFRCEAEVGAVVHDECDRSNKPAFEFVGLLEHLTRVAGFVAVLQESDAARGQFLRRGQESDVVLEETGIEDGVEAWDHDHDGSGLR